MCGCDYKLVLSSFCSQNLFPQDTSSTHHRQKHAASCCTTRLVSHVHRHTRGFHSEVDCLYMGYQLEYGTTHLRLVLRLRMG